MSSFQLSHDQLREMNDSIKTHLAEKGIVDRDKQLSNARGNVLGWLIDAVIDHEITEAEARARVEYFNQVTGDHVSWQTMIETRRRID